MQSAKWKMLAIIAAMVALVAHSDLAAAEPKILWVHRSPENFLSAPVAAGDEVYVAALGVFNSGIFHALAVDPAAKERVRWSKQPPFLKVPSVSSPLVVGSKLIFGDGMHQTDGATLHCLATGTGRALWQLPVPGPLVHIEGTPAAVGSTIFFGAGNAGVMAVDGSRVTFEGRELPLAEVDAELAKRWKQLLEKYEQEKKTDPDFAIPPSEDSLPKAAPKIVWRQGEGKWHVDSEVCAAGEKLFVGSAYLDLERCGERALFCLKTSDGSEVWRTRLTYNPWGGPVVTGDAVLVGTSSVRLDPSTAAKGRGELVCCAVDNGNLRWSKPVPGGIVAPVALHEKLVLFTATDGFLRAVDLATGEDRWQYDAGAPLFGGAVVEKGIAYVADLAGCLHAVQADNGEKAWKLNLSTETKVGGGGAIYGTPCVAAGKLFVATCNLDDPQQRRPSVVVCIDIRP